jgi:hypothetical protein
MHLKWSTIPHMVWCRASALHKCYSPCHTFLLVCPSVPELLTSFMTSNAYISHCCASSSSQSLVLTYMLNLYSITCFPTLFFYMSNCVQLGSLRCEDRGTVFLWNTGNRAWDYIVSDPRRPLCYTDCWENLKILYEVISVLKIFREV